MQSLVAIVRNASGKVSISAHEDATIALAACATKHKFPEADHGTCACVASASSIIATAHHAVTPRPPIPHTATAQTVAALVAAVTPRKSSAREPRFAVTALREMAKRATPGGALERDLAASRVAAVVLRQVEVAPTVWTQRAAAKAMVTFLANPALMAASGVTVEAAMQALDRVGRDDFMVARWAREAHKAMDDSGKAKKKWYE